MNRIMLLALVMALSPMAAVADETPAPAAAAAASNPPPDNYAPPSCTKPSLESLNLSDNKRVAQLNKDLESYRQCMVGYTQAQKALAQKHSDAGSAAAKEFNEFVKSMNEKLKKVADNS